jgi:hypothetical protein
LRSWAGYVGAWSALASRAPNYQAWSAPQCGQATVVETDAANTNPQAHVYEALSIGPPALRTRATISDPVDP